MFFHDWADAPARIDKPGIENWYDCHIIWCEYFDRLLFNFIAFEILLTAIMYIFFQRTAEPVTAIKKTAIHIWQWLIEPKKKCGIKYVNLNVHSRSNVTSMHCTCGPLGKQSGIGAEIQKKETMNNKRNPRIVSYCCMNISVAFSSWLALLPILPLPSLLPSASYFSFSYIIDFCRLLLSFSLVYNKNRFIANWEHQWNPLNAMWTTNNCANSINSRSVMKVFVVLITATAAYIRLFHS